MLDFLVPVPYETKHGRRWMVDFQCKEKSGLPVRVQRRGFMSKGEALMFAEQEFTLLTSGLKKKEKKSRPGPVPRPKAKPTTGEVVLACIEFWESSSQIKPSTASTYRRATKAHIIPLIGDLAWSDLVQKDLAALSSAARGLQWPMFLFVLRRAIKESKRIGFPPPALDIEIPKASRTPKERRCMTTEELERLCVVSSPKWSAVWRLLYFTGLRTGEIRALRWTDWCRSSTVPTLTVCRTVYQSDRGQVIQTPKGGESRTIPLCREAVTAMEDLLSAVRGSAGIPGKDASEKDLLVLPATRTMFVNAAAIGGQLSRACKRANLQHLNPHSSRHGFITALFHGGVSGPTIQVLAGHRSFDTTLVYVHHCQEELRQGVQVLDNLMNNTPAPLCANNQE